MLKMINNQPMDDLFYSLLIIIVNGGKGSKILEFVHKKGINKAICFLGKGTIKNGLLQLIEMDEVNKEIIMLIVSSDMEAEILEQLNIKFHFQRPNHGIAFAMPIARISKWEKDALIQWEKINANANSQYNHVVLLLIVDKGNAEMVVQISQQAGFFGGTIIRARGSASKLNMVLDMVVEPEKEAVLILTERNKADQLASLLSKHLQLCQDNTGILIKLAISNAMGLFLNNSKR
jgi:hypothetical protein